MISTFSGPYNWCVISGNNCNRKHSTFSPFSDIIITSVIFPSNCITHFPGITPLPSSLCNIPGRADGRQKCAKIKIRQKQHWKQFSTYDHNWGMALPSLSEAVVEWVTPDSTTFFVVVVAEVSFLHWLCLWEASWKGSAGSLRCCIYTCWLPSAPILITRLWGCNDGWS